MESLEAPPRPQTPAVRTFFRRCRVFTAESKKCPKESNREKYPCLSGKLGVAQPKRGNFIIKENKVKFALWFAPETRELVEENYRSDGCRSMGEYIEKAILFYTGYRHAEHAEYYLPEALNEVLSRVASDFGDRIGSLLYKQAVEQNIGNHILAADTDMDVETYEKLRSRSLREVKSTNGKISFKDDLIFQKSLW